MLTATTTYNKNDYALRIVPEVKFGNIKWLLKFLGNFSYKSHEIFVLAKCLKHFLENKF